MTAFAEKLKDAGADTIGAQFTVACTEAARRHPTDIEAAWRFVGASFGYEFIRGVIMADMMPRVQTPATARPAGGVPSERLQALAALGEPMPYKPRVIPPERLEKRRELRNIVRSKFRNSGDVPWSDVGWHELYGLSRDGTEAKALLAAGPANVPNDGRTVGDVLGIKRTDEIIGEARRSGP